jgi:hypothetical protein
MSTFIHSTLAANLLAMEPPHESMYEVYTGFLSVSIASRFIAKASVWRCSE